MFWRLWIFNTFGPPQLTRHSRSIPSYLTLAGVNPCFLLSGFHLLPTISTHCDLQQLDLSFSAIIHELKMSTRCSHIYHLYLLIIRWLVYLDIYLIYYSMCGIPNQRRSNNFSTSFCKVRCRVYAHCILLQIQIRITLNWIKSLDKKYSDRKFNCTDIEIVKPSDVKFILEKIFRLPLYHLNNDKCASGPIHSWSNTIKHHRFYQIIIHERIKFTFASRLHFYIQNLPDIYHQRTLESIYLDKGREAHFRNKDETNYAFLLSSCSLQKENI